MHLLQILYEFEEITSGKIFVNGYNEIMKNVFPLLEYNASLEPQHLSNEASFVIFCVKDAGRRPIKITVTFIVLYAME